MKNSIFHIPYSIFLLLLLIVLPLFVFAASEYESDSNIAAGVIGTAGTNATYEISPSTLFKFDSDFGQDLYEQVYNRVKYESADKAVERVLADRKVSKEELFAVIPGANIGKLLTNPDPDVKLNAAEVEKRRLTIQRALAEEKELADLEVRTTMEVQPTELFSNGDESDSGFDLIVDLRVIDSILFGRMESPLSGAGPGAPPGSNVFDLGSGAGAGQPQGAGGAADDAAAGGGPAGAGPGGGAIPTGAGPTPQPTTPGPGVPVQVQCPLSESFNSAVETARAREQIAAVGGQPGGSAGTDAGTGAGGAGSAAGGSGAGGAGGAASDATAEGKEPTLTPEPPADWSRPLPCNGVFCLKIEAVYKRASAFQDTDNCIACHFEKINDSFSKAVSHNLVPSKATGNLIEAPKCKRSMFNLKQNFILIPQPILTPPNDDLIVKGDFLKNWVDYVEKYHANPDQCKALKKAASGDRDLSTKISEVLSLAQACDPDRNERGEAASRALEQAGEGTDQSKIFLEIQNQVAAKKEEAANFLKQARLQSDAANQSSQFSVILQEIDTMNAYFEAFMNLYNQLISGESDSPCRTLINKETCS